MSNEEFSGSKSIKPSRGESPAERVRVRALRAPFWQNSKARPSVGPGWLFIADALEAVGFGRCNWTGEETSVWEGEESEAAARLLAAVSLVTDAARSGTLATSIWRPNQRLRGVGPDAWFGSDALPLFSTGMLEVGGAAGFAFFQEASVLRLAKGSPATPATYDGHLSPYIRLMIAVSEIENVGPSNQPKKEVIEEALRQLAPQFLDSEVPKTFLGYLATAIREPESQAGRASKVRAQ